MIRNCYQCGVEITDGWYESMTEVYRLAAISEGVSCPYCYRTKVNPILTTSDIEEFSRSVENFKQVFYREAIEPWAIPVLNWLSKLLNKFNQKGK